MKQHGTLTETSEPILSVIYRISALLTDPSPIDKVLDSIMESVTEGLGFHRAALYLIKEEKHLLECKCISGFTPETEDLARSRPYDLRRHNTLETRVALTGNAILVKDVYADPVLNDMDRLITRRLGRGCILYVPLKVKGTVIGILGVDKKHSEPVINEKEFETLSIFANYASIIIENSRLYEALLNEKKFSEDVLNSSISGLLTADVHGRITSLNPAAQNILGIEKANVLHRFIRDVFASIPEMDAMLQKTLMYRENMKGCECLLKKDTKINIILSVSSSPIIEDAGNLIGVLFLIQDITSERERDDYLQRVNRLISLGELAAGVAHEIRNPLTGIGVVLDILKSRKRLLKTDKNLIEEATLEIERLEKLISDLLDFARPKEFNFEPADINEIVRSITFLIGEQCNNQGVRLVTRYGRRLTKAYMDAGKIRQGLLNMMINAIQAMPQGGELTIETGGDGADATGENRSVTVTIKDSGAGIPDAVKGRIFDPFFTTHHEGTGLGLSITHSIVKEHGGTIRFDSEEGKGARFVVSLPTALKGMLQK
ncbi:MAG: ATP-binding protein [Syntrophales bacterium]|nr:ATP-binding protein [Syntrophales bacterium]